MELVCPEGRKYSSPSDHDHPAVPGVFLLVLLVSAGCCCLLRPATHAPLLFRADTNLQTLLALRSNLSRQGISCPMCSGGTVSLSHQTYLGPPDKDLKHVASCRRVHGEAPPSVHPLVLDGLQVSDTPADSGCDDLCGSSELIESKSEQQPSR